VKRIVSKLMLAPLLALMALTAGAAVATAQMPAIYMSTPVPGVTVEKGKQVTFSIDVNNTSTVGRTVNLDLVSVPQGWNAILKDRGFVVRSVWVGPGPQKLESVDLQLSVPAEAAGQDYKISLRASGEGFDTTTLDLLVGVQEKATLASSLVVQYPTLKGKSGSTFGFKADLKNDSEADRNYGLTFTAPEGWDVTFKPSYEDKQISSVQVKTGSTQGLDVSVTPPARVEAGDYPVTLTASSPTDRATTELKVSITGTYQMGMTTRTEVFNTSATAGQESPFYVTLVNTGSAPLENLSLSSTKPEGWTVTFQPDKVDAIAPGATREVAMMIKPSANAIAGDYMLNVTASNTQASLDRDVRVQVSTPTLWGWVGIAVLIAVIGGLLGLFMKLGRR
jgi:uncharacterized membrane protein